MPSDITYTTLAKVQRVLRSNAQKRINFSGQYRNLGGDTDNSSAITLSSVSFYDNYVNQEEVILTFRDTTSYAITSVDEKTGRRSHKTVGSSNIYTDYTTSDGYIIGKDYWSNDPAIGSSTDSDADKVVFQTEVHMSTDDLYDYIHDTEIWVDTILKQAVYQDTTVALNTMLFDSTSVPHEIDFATSRLAAFFVFNDVYTVNIEGLQDMEPKAITNTPALNWYRQGMRMLEQYINIYTNQEIASTPRWVSFKKLFTSQGVKGIGRGIAKPERDLAPTTIYDDEYRDLLEPEITITSTDEIGNN